MARQKDDRTGAAPTFKARGRAMSEGTNLARQTDSLAYTVELLQKLLAEQQRTNDLLGQLLSKS